MLYQRLEEDSEILVDILPDLLTQYFFFFMKDKKIVCLQLSECLKRFNIFKKLQKEEGNIFEFNLATKCISGLKEADCQIKSIKKCFPPRSMYKIIK